MTIAQMQIRRGTAAQWTAANPVLADGEWGLETDTGLVKLGLGSVAWNSLPYFPSYIQDQIDLLGPREMLVNTTPGTFSGAAGFEKADYTWLKYIRVYTVGGGGGGGGTAATGVGETSVGGGGGGAGAATAIIPVGTLAAQETVIVGAGGAVAAGASGSTGGTSSFGTVPYLSGLGGGGGALSAASASTGILGVGGNGGSFSGGDFGVDGADGGFGSCVTGTRISPGGYGGASGLGYGTASRGPIASAAGLAGNPYGGGGTGALNQASAGAKAGGVGGDGVVIIELYG